MCFSAWTGFSIASNWVSVQQSNPGEFYGLKFLRKGLATVSDENDNYEEWLLSSLKQQQQQNNIKNE